MNDTHKTVYVDPETTTIEQLWSLTSEKLLLTVDSAECFFIWVVSPDIELLLFAEQTIQDVYDEWISVSAKYSIKKPLLQRTISRSKGMDRSPSKISLQRSPTVRTIGAAPVVMQGALSRTKSAAQVVSTGLADAETPDFKLVYRPTAVLPLEVERALFQPEALHLLYIQAVHHVIHSNYPCTRGAAVALAGLQLQLQLGDQKPEHAPYISEALANYVPEHLRHQRKQEEWSTDVIAAHQLHRGKDPLSLIRQYLDTVQRFPFYGSTFFRAKYIPAITSFYKQEYQGTVALGINHIGIHIVDPKLMKFETWNFHDLVFWDSMAETFVFEVMTKNKKEPSRRYTFTTSQAELINDLMHDWAEEWQKQVLGANGKFNKEDKVRRPSKVRK